MKKQSHSNSLTRIRKVPPDNYEKSPCLKPCLKNEKEQKNRTKLNKKNYPIMNPKKIIKEENHKKINEVFNFKQKLKKFFDKTLLYSKR